MVGDRPRSRRSAGLFEDDGLHENTATDLEAAAIRRIGATRARPSGDERAWTPPERDGIGDHAVAASAEIRGSSR
jgi:hypothetical protein